MVSMFIGMNMYDIQVSGWQDVRWTTQDVWKSTTAEFGEQSVAIHSKILTPVLSAIVLDSGCYIHYVVLYESSATKRTQWQIKRFYRAMQRRAGYEIAYRLSVRLSVRPSVRPSVTFRYRDRIGWNTSKIISWPNSLRSLLTPTPSCMIWCNGNSRNLGWNRGGVRGT